MSAFPIPARQKYCEELNKFIENTEKVLKETCSYLGLDLETTSQKKESYIECPFNTGHRVPERTIEKHLQSCEWNTLGYTKDCIPLQESVLSPDHPSTIKFDMHLQHEILQLAKQQNSELNIETHECYLTPWNHCIDEKLIPKTLDRLVSDLTIDERKAIYEYVITNTVAPDIGKDITDINRPQKSDNRNTTILELLAQERNLKRRRAKYRGVHTNKKSQTEILRELIEQQMEMFKEHISEKFGILIPDGSEENSSHSNNNEEAKIEQKNNQSNFENNSESSSKYKNKYNLDEDDQFQSHKKKYTKNYDEKSDSYSKYHRDRGQDGNHKSYSYSKDYDYKSSLRDDDYRNSLKHDYRSRDCDKHKNHDRNYDRYDSRDRNCDKNNSRNKKRDYNDSRGRKRDRSKSNEKGHDESRHNSKERKSHKKHKKDSKKKRDRSHENDSDRKHKSSKHKHTRHHSRSRSRS